MCVGSPLGIGGLLSAGRKAPPVSGLGLASMAFDKLTKKKKPDTPALQAPGGLGG